MIDIITIFHNEENYKQSEDLYKAIAKHEDALDWGWIPVDNREENRGFSLGCNYGAAQAEGEILGFLNPDCHVKGPFMQMVLDTLAQNPAIVITGSNHGKARQEVKSWGLDQWVCGCTMFVRRDWFEAVGGFDEDYIWSWEDTDLCRTAEAMGKYVLPIHLPIYHASPTSNSDEDSEYKRSNFKEGARLYRLKWGTVNQRGQVIRPSRRELIEAGVSSKPTRRHKWKRT